MDSTIVFIFLLVLGICHVTVAGNGMIGFGLTMFRDLCCQACQDPLSTLHLSCTTFGNDDISSMDVSMPKITVVELMSSDECHATDTPWLQTMACCIQQNCDVDEYSTEKQAKRFSTQAVAVASSPTFHDSLPAIAPIVELVEDAMWLNATSLVNKNTYYATHGTEKKIARWTSIHTRHSYVFFTLYFH